MHAGLCQTQALPPNFFSLKTLSCQLFEILKFPILLGYYLKSIVKIKKIDLS